MTPEDKAMTEKAMMSGSDSGGVANKMHLKDLPSSTIDMAAAVVSNKDVRADIAPSSPTSSEAAPSTSTPPVTPAAPSTEKRKKGFLRLPFFQKKEKEVAQISEAPSGVAETLANESLIKMIDEKLKKISGDEFLTVKINKQGLLILVGFVLVLVWLSPLVELNLPKILSSRYKLMALMQGKKPNPSPEVMPLPTPVPLTESTIRVRMGSNSLEAANEVKGILNNAGFTQVDLMYDPQINPKSLMIVTKQKNELLKQTLEQLFMAAYRVSTESAELTSDSDFAASILIGKSAKINP